MCGLLILVLFLPAARNAALSPKKHTQPTKNFIQVMERDSLINRQPAVAGSFYPASPGELKSEVGPTVSELHPE